MTQILEYSLMLRLDSGELVTLSSAETNPPKVPVEPLPEYAADGFSNETKYNICVRSKVVDEYLDEQLKGDDYEKAVAEKAQRWFALILPLREYTNADLTLFNVNYDQNKSTGQLGGLRIWNFYPDYDATDIYSNEMAEGCATPIYGFNRHDVHEVFEEKYIRMLKRELAYCKFYKKFPKPGIAR